MTTVKENTTQKKSLNLRGPLVQSIVDISKNQTVQLDRAAIRWDDTFVTAMAQLRAAVLVSPD